MTNKRHMLCLFPSLELGGADKFNLDMLAHLARYGWQNTIITTLPSAHAWRTSFARLSDDIVDITEHPPAQYPARLLEAIQARPIDCLLVSNSNLGYRLLPYLRAHLPHLTYVDYCHMEEMYWNDGGYPRMSLRYATMLDLQIVASHHLKRWMCERGGDPERIAICTTNIDSDDWNPARYDRPVLRAAMGIPPQAPVILYAARLVRQKQPALAAQVMLEVVRQTHDAIFLVAGDGIFAGYMRGFLRWHRLERRVRMLGAVSNERMRELLALSDILFLPSQMEGISLTIYEAMAMGVVPVSAEVGGQGELVTPACGLLITRGHNEGAAYTTALLDLLRDPAMLHRMGHAARQRVATHFRLDQMGARMNDLLDKAILLHQTLPRRPVQTEAALTAARSARAAAQDEEMMLRRQPIANRTFRQLLLAVYWRLVNHGLWWLLPPVERIRSHLRPQ